MSTTDDTPTTMEHDPEQIDWYAVWDAAGRGPTEAIPSAKLRVYANGHLPENKGGAIIEDAVDAGVLTKTNSGYRLEIASEGDGEGDGEETVEDSPHADRSRDDLVARVRTLEDLVGVPSDQPLDEVDFTDTKVGRLLESALDRSRENRQRLDELEREDTSAMPDDETLEAMVPIHQTLVAMEHGYDDPTKATRRAAELWRRFVRKLSDDPVPGVEASHGYLKIDSQTAKDIIAETDGDVDRVQSIQVRRAFERLQEMSFRGSCDCHPEECSHGLAEFRAGSRNVVAVNTDALTEYLRDVTDARTDDSGNADEVLDDSAYTVVSREDADGVSTTSDGGDTDHA